MISQTEQLFITELASETKYAKQTLEKNKLHNMGWWLKTHDQVMHSLGLSTNCTVTIKSYLDSLVGLSLTKRQRQKFGLLVSNWINIFGYDSPTKRNGCNHYSTRYIPILEEALTSVLELK